MSATKIEIRSGAYYDSIVLMQLQRSLAGLPGIVDAGVVMGTAANKELLSQNKLLPSAAEEAQPNDLIVVIRGESEAYATTAISQVDALLERRSMSRVQSFRPQSLETAVAMAPDAQWVLISVPGRYAASVAREALSFGKNVFLYSDNVSLEDEIEVKRAAAEKDLLVMGPDCGTAIINGVGLGFANSVNHGPIGLVGASGTGLQAVTSYIHQRGSGITHALGTGGRDLSESVGAISAKHGLGLLANDPETQVIVLISKPPAPKVANELLQIAQMMGKPVVVDFIGFSSTASRIGDVHYAKSLEQAAEIAVDLANANMAKVVDKATDPAGFAPGQQYLRGLFSGGTLAYEAVLILQEYLSEVYSNTPIDQRLMLRDVTTSQQHTIVDLGEDEFTVGRLHPMMDNDLRIRRLFQEAEDPSVAAILLDVVLGYGAHPDPASELAPVIAQAREQASWASRSLTVVAAVLGTDEDPQDMAAQITQLEAAGAHVETSNEAAIRYAGQMVQPLDLQTDDVSRPTPDLSILNTPLSAINVGLEFFTESLEVQEASVVQVDWRPPAGGNERLMSILERMKS